LENTMSP